MDPSEFSGLTLIYVAVQQLSCVWLFLTAWTTAHQASLSFTISWSLHKLMSIESMMPSNHLIPYHHPLLLPSNLPSIRVFSSESALHISWPKYWSGVPLPSPGQRARLMLNKISGIGGPPSKDLQCWSWNLETETLKDTAWGSIKGIKVSKQE